MELVEHDNNEDVIAPDPIFRGHARHKPEELEAFRKSLGPTRFGQGSRKRLNGNAHVIEQETGREGPQCLCRRKQHPVDRMPAPIHDHAEAATRSHIVRIFVNDERIAELFEERSTRGNCTAPHRWVGE